MLTLTSLGILCDLKEYYANPHPNPIERNSYSVRHVFYPPPFTCNKTRLERPKGVKDEVKQARRAKRVAEGHQLEIGAQRAPRFLVCYIFQKYVIQGYQI